jgi:GT2 family glycosyltransferase
MKDQPVCAIIVNWKGWQDSIVCLQSLSGLDEAPLDVLVCDNGSDDDSVQQLQHWLQHAPGMRRSGTDLEWTGAGGAFSLRVRLLALKENLGYAGAINAGIRWAREHWNASLFWLLNNDVEAQPGALRELLAARARVPDGGLCGSVLLDWDRPWQVQAVGGRYRRWLGVGRHVTTAPRASDNICLTMDYPVGASLLVDSDYLDRVGLMEDSYFLYYEEMDWVERGRRAGFRPVIAIQSRLRHKEGASTGSGGGVRHKSLLSEHYGVINRLRITRKFWPHYLPLVWTSLLLVAGDRLAHREFTRAALVLRLMFSPRLWLR